MQGWAPGLASGPGGRWVAGDEHHLHVWSGSTLERTVDLSTMLGRPPRFVTDTAVLSGRYEVDADSGAATERIPVDDLLTAYDPNGNPDQLVVRAVAWTNDGARALVVVEYRPTRLRGATDSVRPGGLLALWRSDDGTVHELDRGTLLASAPVAGDRWLVSGGTKARVFDPGSGEVALPLDTGAAATAVATVGDAVAAGLADGGVVEGNLGGSVPGDRGPTASAVHHGAVSAVALSPDAALVATGDRTGVLVVRRFGAGGEPVLRTEVPGRVDGLCFLAPDHLVVAVGGPERELRHIELNG